MSNYTKSTNFATKDSLSSGNPLKIVKGTEINTEFDNIATAVATKADLNSPTLVTPNLGTPSAAVLTNATGLPLTTGVTGTLATTNGGTGLTSFTANGLLYASSTSALTTGSALTFDGTTLNASTGTPVVRATASTVNALYGFELNGGGLDAYFKAQPNSAELRIGSGRSAGWGGFTTFYIDTSEQMRLTSTGLGIGTSSPGVKLDVSGAIRSTVSGGTPIVYLNNGTTQHSISNSSGAMPFAIDGVEKMRLDSSGNLGLGVTPSAWGSGWAALENKGGSVAANTTSQLRFIHNAYFNGTNWIYKNSGIAPTRYELDTGTHYWFTAPSGTAGNPITFTQAMTLDASGQLQIGTTTADGMLTVSAPANTSYGSFNAATSGFANLTFKTSGTAYAYMGSANAFVAGGTANDFAIRSQNALTFATGGSTERARIDSSGNLLVGTTSTTDVSAGAVTAQSIGTTNTYIKVGHKTSSITGSDFVAFYYDNTQIGGCAQNGTTAVSYNTTSDYRLKDNQQPLTGSGAFIDALQPKTWEWKADGSKGVGFIAHEVQEVSPNSVVGEKDAVDEDGKPKYQAMEYGSAEFIANIIAELQSLRARVAALESKG